MSFPTYFRASVPVSAFLKGDRIQALSSSSVLTVCGGDFPVESDKSLLDECWALSLSSGLLVPLGSGENEVALSLNPHPTPSVAYGWGADSASGLEKDPRQAHAWWPPGVRTRAGPGGGLLKRGPAHG